MIYYKITSWLVLGKSAISGPEKSQETISYVLLRVEKRGMTLFSEVHDHMLDYFNIMYILLVPKRNN